MFKMPRIIVVALFLFNIPATAQTKMIFGMVKDGHSDEYLPFASVQFKNTTVGKVTDSSGAFRFELSQWPSDTLVISSVSYQPYIYILPHNQDTIRILAALEAGDAIPEVVLKLKHTRGWYLWKKILKHKDDNNIFKKDNFTYRVYNRLEVDLNNVNQQKIKKNRLLKPFSKILADHVDSISEDKPILPTFFSETISDYYFQKNPHKTREIILANKISGVKNQSITKYLGALYQNVVIYDNFIPVFDKEFISPLNENGDAYYNYRLADTQRVAGRKFFHLIFIPKHPGQNTFTGDCWVNDTTYAIQKVILHVSKEANINFVDKLSVVQEFRLINDSTWFLSKDKFIVNLNPLGNKSLGFIARKTTNYDHVMVNTSAVAPVLAKNKVVEEVDVTDGARQKDTAFWKDERLEPLTKTEQGIYKMVDSIQNTHAYKRYYNTLYFVATGYKNIGKIQIGPWFSWLYSDSLEGVRTRFDLGTTTKFSKDIFLHGYLAYGFSDKKFKGQADALWLLNHNPRQTLFASYTNDLNFTQNYNTDLPADNIAAVAIRKQNIPIKFISLRETQIQYFHDSKIGLSGTLTLRNKSYQPLVGLPSKELFPITNGMPLTTSEVSLKLRFAYIEKFYETNFFRYSLGSPFPIADVEFTQGIKGLLNSGYTYQKLSASVSGQLSIAPLGKLDYNFFGGKVFGTLPYVFLEVHPGNETYYYNKYAFNLMSKYEYISDKYAGFTLENNFGNGLFRFIPLTRKLKFRQFWNIKGVVGSLSNSNKQLNYVGDYTFKSLDKRMYLEVGTGVDNIFKVFRLDLVWRLLPTPMPANRSSRFGIFGSFKVQL